MMCGKKQVLAQIKTCVTGDGTCFAVGSIMVPDVTIGRCSNVVVGGVVTRNMPGNVFTAECLSSIKRTLRCEVSKEIPITIPELQVRNIL